jgi:hypothetical protein
MARFSREMYPTAKRSADRERRITMISLLLVGAVFFGSVATVFLTTRS